MPDPDDHLVDDVGVGLPPDRPPISAATPPLEHRLTEYQIGLLHEISRKLDTITMLVAGDRLARILGFVGSLLFGLTSLGMLITATTVIAQGFGLLGCILCGFWFCWSLTAG